MGRSTQRNICGVEYAVTPVGRVGLPHRVTPRLPSVSSYKTRTVPRKHPCRLENAPHRPHGGDSVGCCRVCPGAAPSWGAACNFALLCTYRRYPPSATLSAVNARVALVAKLARWLEQTLVVRKMPPVTYPSLVSQGRGVMVLSSGVGRVCVCA